MNRILAIKYKAVDKEKPFCVPKYGTTYASGADLTALDDCPLAPLSVTMIPTNIAVELPVGYEFQVRPRSGFSTKRNIMVINSPGTIDSDYRGEIKVALYNPDAYHKLLKKGERYAQLVLAPVLEAHFVQTDTLSSTERGEGGFGSTDNGAQTDLFNSEKADGVHTQDPYDRQGMPSGKMCAKCGDWFPVLHKPACKHKPELEKGAIGMYHCPDCGIMVLANVPHPRLCASCNLEIESIQVTSLHEKKTKVNAELEDGWYHLYTPSDTGPVLAYLYTNPNIRARGFGFNIKDGGGFLPLWDVVEGSWVVPVNIGEINED